MRNKISWTSLFLFIFVTSISHAADIQFAWDPVTTDDRVAGYELHWGAETDSYTDMESVPGVETGMVVIDIPPGNYFAAVRSVNDDGTLTSVFSNEVVFASPEPPLPSPEGLSVTIVQAIFNFFFGECTNCPELTAQPLLTE